MVCGCGALPSALGHTKIRLKDREAEQLREKEEEGARRGSRSKQAQGCFLGVASLSSCPAAACKRSAPQPTEGHTLVKHTHPGQTPPGQTHTHTHRSNTPSVKHTPRSNTPPVKHPVGQTHTLGQTHTHVVKHPRVKHPRVKHPPAPTPVSR